MNDFDPLHILSQRKDLPRDRYGYKLNATSYGMDTALSDTIDCDESQMSLWINFADGNKRDGVGDLLEIGGIDTSRHRKNPVVLFDHGKQVVLPIAMACGRGDNGRYNFADYTVELDPEISKQARLNAFFYQGQGLPGAANADEYQHAVFCEQLYDMAVKRMVVGGSIGYQVKRALELRADPEQGTPQGLHLLSTLMLEGSLVVMPANMNTVRKVLSDGRLCGKTLSPVLCKHLGACVPCETKAVVGFGGTTPVPLAQLPDKPNPPPVWKPGVGARKQLDPKDPTAQAYRQGYQAQREGKPQTANPFTDSYRKTAWEAGWLDASLGHADQVQVKTLRAKYKMEARFENVQNFSVGDKVVARKILLYRNPVTGKMEPFADTGDRLVVVSVNGTNLIVQRPDGIKKHSGGTEVRKVRKSLEQKSLDLTAIRKKYRPMKGLRRRLKRSSPGKAIIRVRSKNVSACKDMAERSGLQFERVGSLGSHEKVKLSGADEAIDTVAREYGERKSLEGAMGTKSHLKGAARDAGKKAALADLSNGTTSANPYSNHDEENKAAWQTAYDKARRDLTSKNPFWPGVHVAFRIGSRQYSATVIPPGQEQGYVKVRIDSVQGEGGSLKPGSTTSVRASDLSKKSLTGSTKAMKINQKTMGDGMTTPPEPEVEEFDVEAPEAAEEKYSAQVLRRLHEDATLLLQQYEELRGPLEHEGVDTHLQTKLENLVSELEEIEALFAEHHPDAEPLAGTKDLEDEEPIEENPVEEEAEEDLEANDEDLEEIDEADSEVEEEPTPEEVFEGSTEEAEPDTKALRHKYGKGVKALRTGQDGMGLSYAEEGDYKVTISKEGKPYPKMRRNGSWGIANPGDIPEDVLRRLTQAAQGAKSLKGNAKCARCGNKACKGCKTLKGKKKDMDEEDEKDFAPMDATDETAEVNEPGEKELGSLEDHEMKKVKDAATFCKELSEEPNFGDEHRMKAFHYHKALDEIGSSGMDDMKDFAAMDRVDGMNEINEPGEKDLDETGGELPPDMEHKDLHPHRKMCKDCSGFLHELSQERAFGDLHREKALHWHKALSDISGAETEPGPDEQMEHMDAADEVGEMGEKGLTDLINLATAYLGGSTRALAGLIRGAERSGYQRHASEMTRLSQRGEDEAAPAVQALLEELKRAQGKKSQGTKSLRQIFAEQNKQVATLIRNVRATC